MKTVYVIIGLLVCISALGRDLPSAGIAISTDIASLIMSRSLSIGVSHPISDKWSAEGNMAIQIQTKEASEDQQEHDSMLNGREESIEDSMNGVNHELTAGVKFWPKGFMEGVYIGISCTYAISQGADLGLGLGYSIRIWKSIWLAAGYNIKLSQCAKNGIFNTKGINLMINYKF